MKPPVHDSISIVIAVYNDWAALDRCLQSIELQKTDWQCHEPQADQRQFGDERAKVPGFEVVVVDDGSSESTPEAIQKWARRLPLTIVRQAHAGISAARNRGIQTSVGSIILFSDADCRFQPNCLEALDSAIAASPQHNYFQLRLIGIGKASKNTLVARAEDLRLKVLQDSMVQPDGRIRYLNTAGFALRRTHAEVESGLFDPRALRSEDTLLLANLIEQGQSPFFVSNAVIQHDVQLSLPQSFYKSIRSAMLESAAYDAIGARGIKVRMSNRARLDMVRSAWNASKQPSIGRIAWLLLIVRQALQRLTSGIYPFFRGRPDSKRTDVSSVTRP